MKKNIVYTSTIMEKDSLPDAINKNLKFSTLDICRFYSIFFKCKNIQKMSRKLFLTRLRSNVMRFLV